MSENTAELEANKMSENPVIQKIFEKAIKNQEPFLGYEESRRVLAEIGIPFNKTKLVTSEDEAVKVAEEFGFPVVFKVVSPDISHKTEIGGVKVGIQNPEEARAAYKSIMESVKKHKPNARIEGIMVEEQVSGSELFVGVTKDPQFGHMIGFGMGGIFVEVYKDVTFRLIPIGVSDAYEMLQEIRGKKIYEGYRGRPKADPKELVKVLLSVSQFIENYPMVKEMDINPLMVTFDGIKAIDARIILDLEYAEKNKKD